MNSCTPPAATAPSMEQCADFLIDLGIAPKVAKPTLYRLLWSRGFRVRPPLYASFLQRFLIQGLLLAIVWGKGMHVMGKLDHGFPTVLITPLFFGAAMTLALQIIARRIRRNHELPPWDELLARAGRGPA